MTGLSASIAGSTVPPEVGTLLWILAALAVCAGAVCLLLWRRKARLDRLRRWADENGYAVLQIDEIPAGGWPLLGLIGKSGLRVRVEDEEGGLAEFEITFRLRRMDMRRV